MSSVARKVVGRRAYTGSQPAENIQPATPNELATVLSDRARFPSPVRAVGANSSTTRCTAAIGGTLIDMSGMNRILRLTDTEVTVQPGISLPELAEALAEKGLELAGGFDLAHRSVGGAVCAAGLEAAVPADGGQLATHAMRMKLITPQGRKISVGEKSRDLLSVLRLSYGLLGVIYEVTLRVRPIRGFSVYSNKLEFESFARTLPQILAANAGVRLCMLPFRNRIYVEMRRAGSKAAGHRLSWRFRDWACYSALPDLARSMARTVPFRKLRYPLIDGFSEATQTLVSNTLSKAGSNSAEQSGRFRKLDLNKRFTYTTWAFPAAGFDVVAMAYRDFCTEYYQRTGFRCDMPTIGFRLNHDRSALLSPSFDGPLFTLSPLCVAAEEWEDFVLDFADFAESHGGVPLFNQTKGATSELVSRTFAKRLGFFNKVRKQLDPHDRLLNQYFAAYVG